MELNTQNLSQESMELQKKYNLVRSIGEECIDDNELLMLLKNTMLP